MKTTVPAVIFSLIVGLGVGIAIGRNLEPFAMGVKPQMETESGMTTEFNLSEGDFDRQFIQAMIIHHQGAIDMANEALDNSERPEILRMSHDIVEVQTQEIATLEQWEREWYGDR